MYELLALQSALLNLNQEDPAWSILTSTESGSFQLDFAQISANSARVSNDLSHIGFGQKLQSPFSGIYIQCTSYSANGQSLTFFTIL